MPSDGLKIGVLAFQGAFLEHKLCLLRVARQEGLDLTVVEVNSADELRDLHGLIIPGGESTTMSKFLARSNFESAYREWLHSKETTKTRIVWGTCAGLILLANKVAQMKKGGQIILGGLGITATRNIFGRQSESFEAVLNLKSPELDTCNRGTGYHGVFIRAPGIESIDDEDVTVLATLQSDGKEIPVGVRQGHYLATTFHPELTHDLRWHAYFLHQILKSKEDITD